MKKRLLRKFTLVELLVVITIIAVLMGLLMPSLTTARDSASRTNSNNFTKQIAMSIAGETALSRRSTYSGMFATNFRTLTGLEKDHGDFNNAFALGFPISGHAATFSDSTEPLLQSSTKPTDDGSDPSSGNIMNSPAYSFLADFAGRHPFDPDGGYYVFAGQINDLGSSTIRAKKKNDISTRVSGEVYTDELGDDKSGISYSDGHTATMNNVDVDGTTANGNIFSGYIYTLNIKGEPSSFQAID